MSTHDPNAESQQLLDRVVQLITRTCQSQLKVVKERHNARDPKHYPHSTLKQPRLANVVGILGPRGAGKTWLLSRLMERPQGKCEDLPLYLEIAQKTEFWYLPPLDCSLAPANLPPLLTVMHAVRSGIDSLLDGRHDRCTCPKSRNATAEDQARNHFELAAEVALRSSSEAREVIRNTSTSFGHFGKVTHKQIEDRFQLLTMIQTWLDSEVLRFRAANPNPNSKAEGFILPLDDLDLVTSDIERGIIWTLLDEWHQDRVLFVVSGDLKRLEQHLARYSAGGNQRDIIPDVALGRALLQKVMPESARLHLRPWPMERRLGFSYDTNPNPDEKTNLGSLIHNLHIQDIDNHQLRRLLPPFPRGLKDLWNWFHDDSPRSALSTDEVLSQWAESRGEADLARMMRIQPLGHIAWLFRWADRDLVGPAWRMVVQKSRDPDIDVPELLPEEPDRVSLPERRGLSLPERREVSFRSDLTDEQEPRWPEVLVDLALRRGTLTPWLWSTSYKPVGTRLGRTDLRINLSLSSWIDFFDEPPLTALAELFWLEADPPDATQRVPTQVGWNTLYKLLSGNRALYPERLLAQLFVGTAYIDTRVPEQQQETLAQAAVTQTTLLPKTVRGLILVADAMSDIPWSVLSAQVDDRSPGFFARMCAMLSWAAMVRAIRQSTDQPGVLLPLDFAQTTLLATCHGTATQQMTRWDDEEMRKRFEQLGRTPPELKSELSNFVQRSIYEALTTLMAHPAFAGLFPAWYGGSPS